MESAMNNANLLEQINAPAIYLIAGAAIALVAAMCVYFMVKSWRAGVAVGMDKAVLRKAIVSSATFTVLPAVSVLLGVVALSGSLGIPLPWLRLSVIGNLQYEVKNGDSDMKVTFKSSDPNVVTVDENGVIIGRGEGVATVTLTAEDGTTCTWQVTVNRGINIWQ